MPVGLKLTLHRHGDRLPAANTEKVTMVGNPNLLDLYQANDVQWLFIEEVYYMLVHWTIKQAFLLFYLRLSPKKNFHIAVYCTMAVNASFTIINWLLAFLQCRPLDAMIHPSAHPNPQCINQFVVMMVPTALVRKSMPPIVLISPVFFRSRPDMFQNALSDIIILFLPIPTVLSLRMSRRRKAAVLGVILFGSFSVITALCRFSLQMQMVTNPDTTYVMGRMLIAAAIEIEVAVIAVNLPALKTLFTRFVGGSTADNSYKMSDYKSGSSKGLKGSGFSSTQKEPKSQRYLGVTLTGSEEDLLRQGREKPVNITVTTNIDVATEQYQAGPNAHPVNIGLPPSQAMSEIRTTP